MDNKGRVKKNGILGGFQKVSLSEKGCKKIVLLHRH